jgi:hypothetical protein
LLSCGLSNAELEIPKTTIGDPGVTEAAAVAPMVIVATPSDMDTLVGVTVWVTPDRTRQVFSVKFESSWPGLLVTSPSANAPYWLAEPLPPSDEL